MALSLIAAPTGEPVSLDEAKAQCNVNVDDDNGLLDNLIAAAREYVETFTHRVLLTQTWDLKLDAFPYDGAIWLPMPPVSSVTSVTYRATDGTSTTWSSSLYDTDLPSGPKAHPARIVPAYAQFYPVTRDMVNAVTVRFVCGYGAAGDVPSSIKSAMLLLIGHWYTNREAVNVGNITSEIPVAAPALLWPYKAFA